MIDEVLDVGAAGKDDMGIDAELELEQMDSG